MDVATLARGLAFRGDMQVPQRQHLRLWRCSSGDFLAHDGTGEVVALPDGLAEAELTYDENDNVVFAAGTADETHADFLFRWLLVRLEDEPTIFALDQSSGNGVMLLTTFRAANEAYTIRVQTSCIPAGVDVPVYVFEHSGHPLSSTNLAKRSRHLNLLLHASSWSVATVTSLKQGHRVALVHFLRATDSFIACNRCALLDPLQLL